MKYKNVKNDVGDLKRVYTLQIWDLLNIIYDYYTEIDVVKNNMIIYKIKRGARYGSEFCKIADMKVKYLTAVDYRTVEVGVED